MRAYFIGLDGSGDYVDVTHEAAFFLQWWPHRYYDRVGKFWGVPVYRARSRPGSDADVRGKP